MNDLALGYQEANQLDLALPLYKEALSGGGFSSAPTTSTRSKA